MVDDGIVRSSEYARRRLNKDKVILVGHSWGSFLGVNMIKKRPDLFYAYVGTGQVVSWSQTTAVQYAYAMKRAESEGNQDRHRELREIGPGRREVSGARNFFTAQKVAQSLSGPFWTQSTCGSKWTLCAQLRIFFATRRPGLDRRRAVHDSAVVFHSHGD